MTKPSNTRLVDIVSVLFERAVKVRYRGSKLGILWSALNPLTMAIVYVAIFGRTFAPYFDNSPVKYAGAVYIGLAVGGLFVAGTTQALTSIVLNAGLLNKVRVPFEAFPISVVAAQAFQQAVGTLPIVIVISLIANHDLLHVLGLAIPIAGLTMLTLGVALIASAADVYFRDVQNIYELVMFLVWLTSPVFYPAAIVPARVLDILALNPLYSIMESMRTLVLSDHWPSATMLAFSFIDGAIFLLIGVAVFRSLRPRFMEQL